MSDFCSFCDTAYTGMIKHVSTHWLSLESAVTRILPKHAGLKSYFLSSDDSSARFKRLQQQFEDPLIEVHLFFYRAVLQQFVHANKFMQLENPLIPIVYEVLHDFLTKLCCRFLSVSKVKEIGAEKIDWEDEETKKCDQQLDIGFTTKSVLAKLIDEGHDSHKIQQFYRGVRSFYEKACSYARKNLPLSDPLLKNARFLNFTRRELADLSEVDYFIERFSLLFPFRSDPAKMDQLWDEFTSYQLLQKSDVPSDIWEKATIYPEPEHSCSKSSLYAMDTIWAYLATMMSNVDGSERFALLTQVAHLVLTIPHSNAAEEPVFSIIRKNKTPFRPNLDSEETLGSIVTTKMALSKDVPPYKFEPPKDLLVAAKKATREYNLGHSNKS